MNERMLINISITVTGNNDENMLEELQAVVNTLVDNGWNIIVEEKKMPYDPENNICFSGCVATKG